MKRIIMIPEGVKVVQYKSKNSKRTLLSNEVLAYQKLNPGDCLYDLIIMRVFMQMKNYLTGTFKYNDATKKHLLNKIRLPGDSEESITLLVVQYGQLRLKTLLYN